MNPITVTPASEAEAEAIIEVELDEGDNFYEEQDKMLSDSEEEIHFCDGDGESDIDSSPQETPSKTPKKKPSRAASKLNKFLKELEESSDSEESQKDCLGRQKKNNDPRVWSIEMHQVIDFLVDNILPKGLDRNQRSNFKKKVKKQGYSMIDGQLHRTWKHKGTGQCFIAF